MSSDTLFRFLFKDRNVRGEIVDLAGSLQQMLQNHNYPYPVKQLLAEMVAATSLLTATLKFEGDISVQLQGNGPIRYATVNGSDQQVFRGVVRLQSEVQGEGLKALVGDGYLLVTITPHQGERYQGIIPLTGDSLKETLEAYFIQSEQLPTRVYLYTDMQSEQVKAAGMLLQVLPVEQEKSRQDFDELVILADTITADELLQLPAAEVVHRLFHQEQVEAFPLQPVRFECGCSRTKCESAIINLGAGVIQEHIAEGQLDIQCEYCLTNYRFDATDLSQLLLSIQ
ncbi:Hsp33 family molecular chaperone HslO [Alkalimonas mucilaginosa]|uniref:33 kDa chaperonin n=1 Tax=Alkalimonas mucilaginosa TaxID=3057676 RepID=A0ABU7JIC1_9GAMM|nr:Hsp33 family molecular chaperone HslO [Alkalimonas sp. MEB004]MEE2025419.1 Hsp33 family molecular chaperone HslO [Alkalimonas sp. MEB004]